jgi:lipid II:glycine glycyltransferase (peptidoglycan interpeptide bridge formation enzyme)
MPRPGSVDVLPTGTRPSPPVVPPRRPPGATLTLRVVNRADHLRFIEAGAHGDAVSFLQCPSWGELKNDWGSESLGWFDGGRLVGTALVLYRTLPRSSRCLAYLPEGPCIDWTGERVDAELADWLNPLLAHLRSRRAFTVKIGPKVITRSWSAQAVKAGIADPLARRFGDLTTDRPERGGAGIADRLRALGWSRQEDGGGFGDFQPRLLFRLPLAGRTESELWAATNQQWRRNVRTAERAGVEVVRGTEADLPEFHRLYLETAERDRFTPRPLSYFERMLRVLNAEHPDRVRLYMAVHQGEALAAATMVRVDDYAWYGYGASANRLRGLKPSNAVQWRMIRDCVADGIRVYDLRGIGDTLDEAHHLFGLLRFKVGTGGEAVEYLGEWDFPLNRLLHTAFRLYLKRR